jgi:asparagine synthase (glutamine-hydrolysing)
MIAHRGPDDEAEAFGDGWWMGFRRLSILDLSEHGRQPMRFGGGRFSLTFNGEIYNFRELRMSLAGANLSSSGDTAVLGTLLSHEAVERVLPRLRGMFAFAWWDEETRTLVLVRDHFGIKPLYYRVRADGELVYGSEVKAVRALSGSCAISRAALADYLRWGAVQAPETMFEEVRSLPPGYLAIWRNGKFETKRWFQPSWPGREAWVRDAGEQRRLVREGVLASVKTHLVADVPVGVFLSGGLDSTLVAACMRAAGQEKVRAFSIGYEEDAGVPDETATAERTAEFLGCEFMSERLTATALESRLNAYFDDLDQPTGDALNTWLVSQVAAREVKAALSGLGADEWWAGYNYHRLAALAARSPLHAASGLLRRVDEAMPEGVRGHMAWKALFHLLGGAGKDAAAWQAYGRTVMPPREVARLLQVAEISLPRQPAPEPLATASWLHDLLLRETQTYLANTLLRDNDVTSMAHSLELRVPLVDVEVFALAGRMPPQTLLDTRGGKLVLREAFRELLPPWIYADRRKKTFTLPLMKWMRSPRWQERIRSTLSSQTCRERGWLNVKVTARICESYFSSSLESKAAWPLSQRVWMLYVLEEWARRQLDART